MHSGGIEPQGYNVQSLEYTVLSLPLPHPKDEDIPRIGGQTWSWTQAITPNPVTTKHQFPSPK